MAKTSKAAGGPGANWKVLLCLAALVAAGIAAALFVALEMDVAPDEEDGAPGGGAADVAGGGGNGSGGSGPGSPAAHRPTKPGPAPAVAGFGIVRGQVRLFKTKEPVAGLSLALKQAEGAALAVPTGPDGVFVFSNVPAGPGWELRGGREGFAPIEMTGLDLAPDQTIDVGVLWLAVPVDLPAIVMDSNGRPVEGAEVAAFAMGRTLPEAQDEWSAELREQRTLALVSEPRPNRTAKTDAKGHATVTGLMPGAYRAVASAKVLAPASRTNLLLTPDAKPQPVRFILGPAHALEGTVTDVKGAPVANARVIAAKVQGWLPTLDKASGDTGADGKYRIDGLASGSYFVYLARQGSPLLQVGQVGIPDTTRFDVHLRPGGTIRGTVTGDDGKPVAGAEIHASMQNTWSPMGTKTDKDGRFEFKDVPAGPLGYFGVTSPGFIPFPDPTSRQQGAGESLREGQVMVRDVTLRRGLTVACTVTGDGKGPLEGAEVRFHLAAMWSGDTPPWKSVTDMKGRAEITGLLPGEYLAVVLAEGWVQPGLPQDVENILQAPTAFPALYRVSVGPEGAPEREFRLTRGSAASGRVFASSGKPLAGAVVTIDGVRSDFPVFSDADGRFRIEAVPALRRAVARAVAPDAATGESEPFAVKANEPAENVEIHLKDPGRVTGTVQTRDGRAPQGAFVRFVRGEVSDGDWWAWRAAETAERYPVSTEGAFEIPDAPVGPVTVRVDGEGYLPAFKSVVVTSGVETGGVALVLGTSREIRGRVQSQQNAPVEGATVSAQWQQGLQGSNAQFTPGLAGNPIAKTDAEGRFVLKSVLDGQWGLWATAPGFAGGTYVVTSTEAGEVLLTLTTGKSITGIVKNVDGSPFAGIPVNAERTDRTNQNYWGWWGAQAYTAPDGTFELQDVAEGNYRLRVSGMWQWGREVNVEDTVREGVSAGDKDVEIIVKQGLVIEGRLVDKEKHPIRVAWITASYQAQDGNWSWESQRWVQVKPDGTFRISGLKPGPYNVEVYGSFKHKQQEGVAAGTKDLEIQVEDAWAISGVVLDAKGFSVPYFEVQIRKEHTEEWNWCETVMPGDGEFVLTGLDEGRYDVQMTAEGSAPGVARNVAAGRRDVEIRLTTGLEIAGVLVDGGGRPVKDAYVEVTSTRIAEGSSGISTGASTDESGRFRVGGLAPGGYRVVARGENRAPVIRRDVAAGSDDLKIVLGAGTTVKGTLVDAAGAPVPSMSVALLTDDGLWVAGGQADAEGKFEIRFVPDEGKWKVQVEGNLAGRYVEYRPDATIESGATDAKIEVKP